MKPFYPVLLLYGMPVYRLKTTFLTDNIQYSFDGIINGHLLKHAMINTTDGHPKDKSVNDN